MFWIVGYFVFNYKMKVKHLFQIKNYITNISHENWAVFED
jgi:hypothetical protein